MPQAGTPVDAVLVPATVLRDPQDTICHKLREDPLHRPLGDPHFLRDVTNPRHGIP